MKSTSLLQLILVFAFSISLARKILIPSVGSTDIQELMISLGNQLSKQGNHNVTILSFEHYQGQRVELDNLIFVPFPDRDQAEAKIRQEDLDAISSKNELSLFSQSLYFYSELYGNITYQHQFLEYLKQQNYDMMITVDHYFDDTLAKLLQIDSFIRVDLKMMDPIKSKQSGSAYLHSTETSLLKAHLMGIDNSDIPKLRFEFKRRLRNFYANVAQSFLFEWYQKYTIKQQLHESYQWLVSEEKAPNLTIVQGIEGLKNQLPLPPNVKHVYPLVKEHKDLLNIKSMDMTSFEPFFEEHEKIILAKFHGPNRLSNSSMQAIIDFGMLNSQYGLIIEVRDKSEYKSEIFLNSKFSTNIKIVSELSLEAAMKHEKVKIIITNDKDQLMIEAILSRKAVIAAPLQRDDQVRNCELFQDLQIGFCFYQLESLALQEAVTKLEAENYYFEKIQRLKNAIERKQESTEDFLYWVQFVFNVGTENLVPTQYREMHWFQQLDLDITLTITGVCFLMALLISSIIGQVIIWFKPPE